MTAFGAECRENRKKSRECYGGVARIKHVADTIRREHPNTVFLNAGDFFQVSYLQGDPERSRQYS